MNRGLHFAALFSLLALCGCESVKDCSLTYKLWDTDSLRSYCEPAPKAELQLFVLNKADEIYVQYNELCESRDRVERRIYSLQKNLERIPAGRRPVFISAEKFESLHLVALSQAQTNQPSTNQIVYTVSTNGNAFTIFWNGKTDGPYELPVYQNGSGRVMKTALTPVMIAGDTVMVGFVAGVIWVISGGPAWLTE